MSNNSKCSGYAGKISNKGGQVVNAVYSQKSGKTGTVKRGEDLRTGSKSK
jgi:hypothetical protein